MRLDKPQIVDLLSDIEMAPLAFRWVDPDARVRDPICEVSWGSKLFRFTADVRPVANPKAVDQAIWRLLKNRRANISDPSDAVHPMIVAPYLSDRVMQMLLDHQVSGIDLSGNIQLVIPEQLLFSRIGWANQYPSSDPIKNVYRKSSSIVPRVFFSHPRFTSVTELHFEIRVRGATLSLGTVSKVLKTLEEDLYIDRSGGGITLTDPMGMLDSLTENFDASSGARSRGRVKGVTDFVSRLAARCANSGIQYCIDQPWRYAIDPGAGAITRIYVEDIKLGMNEQIFEPDEASPNIELIETSDSSVYFDRRIENSVYYASPVQSYLTLMNDDVRDPILEKQLRDELSTNARAHN